ncbi:MAG TPA: MarR family transcriptional regulator [Rhodospirillaceae bacterium]|nr:MarR family transcriptional regulator [Rhodospirillaceae bacterium]
MGKPTYKITGASAAAKPRNQRPAVEGFLLLLRELQKIDPEFPLQYAVCLCEIAMDEGLSLTRLAQKTGMALSTVSRIVGALSRDRQKGKPYGLVRVVVSAAERRRRELYLTVRGKAVIDSIADLSAR